MNRKLVLFGHSLAGESFFIGTLIQEFEIVIIEGWR